MSPIKNQIVNMIDHVQEEDLVILLTLIQRLCQDADDIATEDDIECHRLAVEEYQRGETVRHEDIDWD